MDRQIRRVGVALLALICLLFVQLNYLQIVRADKLANDPGNARKATRDFNRERGVIQTADGVVVAESVATPDGKFKRLRRYPEAARLFAADMKAAGRSAATLQLLIACSSETVQKAVESVGSDELLIVPVQYQGRDCYRLCWGVYPSPALSLIHI